MEKLIVSESKRSTAPVHLATTDEDILACLPVMVQLRPHLTDAHAFLEQVKRQRAQQYELAYVAESGRPVAVAGFRINECLYAGKFLYVDDLVRACE